MSTPHDPLAQFRKVPAAVKNYAARSTGRDGYEAFAAKDKANCLRIRSRTRLVNAPSYNSYLNVVYDEDGTYFVLVFSIMFVVVRGRSLLNLIFAIENRLADYIQEFDPARWDAPSDAKAAFIESIEIAPVEGSPTPSAGKITH